MFARLRFDYTPSGEGTLPYCLIVCFSMADDMFQRYSDFQTLLLLLPVTGLYNDTSLHNGIL